MKQFVATNPATGEQCPSNHGGELSLPLQRLCWAAYHNQSLHWVAPCDFIQHNFIPDALSVVTPKRFVPPAWIKPAQFKYCIYKNRSALIFHYCKLKITNGTLWAAFLDVWLQMTFSTSLVNLTSFEHSVAQNKVQPRETLDITTSEWVSEGLLQLDVVSFDCHDWLDAPSYRISTWALCITLLLLNISQGHYQPVNNASRGCLWDKPHVVVVHSGKPGL